MCCAEALVFLDFRGAQPAATGPGRPAQQQLQQLPRIVDRHQPAAAAAAQQPRHQAAAAQAPQRPAPARRPGEPGDYVRLIAVPGILGFALSEHAPSK